MKAASLAEIKKELKYLDETILIEYCLRFGRFKKDNKELLTYLLFEASNESNFILSIKNEIDEEISNINTNHTYYIKKSLRKTLRNITKYIRYSGSKQTEVEILIHFCSAMKELSIKPERGTVLGNIYFRQIDKIKKAMKSLHDDLQADYEYELEQIID